MEHSIAECWQCEGWRVQRAGEEWLHTVSSEGRSLLRPRGEDGEEGDETGARLLTHRTAQKAEKKQRSAGLRRQVEVRTN